jgi:hypothetical protein
VTARLVRKPPGKTAYTDRMRITLEGNHTAKQKVSMLLQAKFLLQHDHGITFFGPSDFYAAIVDAHGYPLTNFPDGQLITDFNIVIDSPYHCAADDYDRQYTPSALRPF